VMAVALVLSLSRAGIVSFLSAVLLIGTILLLGRATKKWVLLPGLLIAILLISLAWFGLGPIFDRYQTLLRLPEDRSMQGRIAVWRDVAKMTADRPFMGSGLGTFGAVYPAYKTLPDPVVYDHAHNDYVQLLAETGWAGFGLAVGILGIVFGFILAGWRGRRSPWARGLLTGVVTGLVALLIHGLNDFNFHIPSNAALFAVLLGLAVNLSRPERPETGTAPASVPRRAVVSSAGLAAVGLLLIQTASAFAADRHYRGGLDLEKTGRYEEAGEEYRRAIGRDPAHFRYHFALGQVSGSTLHSLFDRMSDTAISFSEETLLERNPRDPDLLDVTIPVPGNTLVRLLPDYYKRTLGVPFYVPFDDTTSAIMVLISSGKIMPSSVPDQYGCKPKIVVYGLPLVKRTPPRQRKLTESLKTGTKAAS